MNDRPVSKILDTLQSVSGHKPTRNGKGWIARCPAHDDRKPSLSISEGDDGRALLHCHAGCETTAIVSALGLEMKNLMPGNNSNGRVCKRKPATATKPAKVFTSADEAIKALERKHGPRSASWTYHDGEGELVGLVVRWDRGNNEKDILPVSLTRGRSGWIIGAMPTPRPLYGLPDLAEAQTVVVAEGEKAADAARSLGFTVTTSSGGSQAASKTDWVPLAGKDVVIFPDNDDAGKEYTQNITKILSKLSPAPTVKIVELPGLSEKGDAADFIASRRADGLTDDAIRAEIEALAHAAEPVEIPDSIRAPIEGERARNESWRPIPASELAGGEDVAWVWEGYAAREHVTLLTGLWKAGKTTLTGYLMRAMESGGELGGKVAAGKVLVISEESAALWACRRDELGIGDHARFIVRPFMGRPTPTDWEKFCTHVAKMVGDDSIVLVIIDSWQAVSPVKDENDAAQTMRALTPLHRIAQAGAAVLLIHHPRKGDGTEGQAARGSGAIGGFVDVILEFRRFNGSNRTDTRRTLTAYSRFDETPAEVVLDYDGDGYRVVGSSVDAKQADRLKVIQELLPTDPPGWTSDGVRAEWPDGKIPKPGKRTTDADLQEGAKRGLWARTGDGRKGDPYRFHRPPGVENSFRARSHTIERERKTQPPSDPTACFRR